MSFPLGASSFVHTLFWVAIGVLLVLAFLRVRSTLAKLRRRSELDDGDVRRIVETGSLVREEELDLDEIEEEERRFWESESWDQAEEW